MNKNRINQIFEHLFTKFGLDTNVIIDLILYQKAQKYFKEKGYDFPDKFLCVPTQVIGETKGVLINKYDYSLDKANKAIDKILREFSIEKLPQINIEDDIKIIEEIGLKNNLNEEDITIIYYFWKYKVVIVLVRDKAFENTCKDIGINTINWPEIN